MPSDEIVQAARQKAEAELLRAREAAAAGEAYEANGTSWVDPDEEAEILQIIADQPVPPNREEQWAAERVADLQANGTSYDRYEAEIAAKADMSPETSALLDAIIAEHQPETPTAPVLPEEFWSARPALAHIRQAARARLVSPDALMGAVLARVCQHTDQRIVLPPPPRTGSLNLFVGLVGPSGAGKGSVSDESRSLLGRPQPIGDFEAGEAPAGSGEGMVRTYFDNRKDPDDNRRRILVQARSSMLIRVDEGETLRHLAGRQGQTTWTMLRSAFSGESLGGSYADELKQSRLEAHSYRLALLMGIQPELAAFILDDHAGGTPQRFIWLSVLDPAIPDLCDLPDHPGPLSWQPPWWTDPQVQEAVCLVDGMRRVEMGIIPEIRAEIDCYRHQVVRGDPDADPLDSHTMLLRLKVAGLLAILDGRVDIDGDDWWLAAMVVATSSAVRDWVRERIAAEGERREESRRGANAEGAARNETAKAAAVAKVERVAKVIARKVARAGECSRRDLMRSVASRDADEFDAALGLALRSGWLAEDDEGYSPGPVEP